MNKNKSKPSVRGWTRDSHTALSKGITEYLAKSREYWASRRNPPKKVKE